MSKNGSEGEKSRQNRRRARQRAKKKGFRAKQRNEEIPIVKTIKPLTKIVLRRPKAVLVRGSIENPTLPLPKE